MHTCVDMCVHGCPHGGRLEIGGASRPSETLCLSLDSADRPRLGVVQDIGPQSQELSLRSQRGGLGRGRAFIGEALGSKWSPSPWGWGGDSGLRNHLVIALAFTTPFLALTSGPRGADGFRSLQGRCRARGDYIYLLWHPRGKPPGESGVRS